MKPIIFALLLALTGAFATTGCQSACSKYADAEISCDGLPSDERRIIEAMCMASEMESDNEISQSILADVKCAKQHGKDCAAYKKCTQEN